jgi:hypothetical protein
MLEKESPYKMHKNSAKVVPKTAFKDNRPITPVNRSMRSRSTNEACISKIK